MTVKPWPTHLIIITVLTGLYACGAQPTRLEEATEGTRAEIQTFIKAAEPVYHSQAKIFPRALIEHTARVACMLAALPPDAAIAAFPKVSQPWEEVSQREFPLDYFSHAALWAVQGWLFVPAPDALRSLAESRAHQFGAEGALLHIFTTQQHGLNGFMRQPKNSLRVEYALSAYRETIAYREGDRVHVFCRIRKAAAWRAAPRFNPLPPLTRILPPKTVKPRR